MIITGPTREPSPVERPDLLADEGGAVPNMVAVVITRIYRNPLLLRARECGLFYRYETHLDGRDGLAVRVSCLCPRGHGVAGLAWRGWLRTENGRFDLADMPDPRHLPVPARLADLRAASFTLDRAVEDAA